jgi:hypothetical protein
LNPELEFRHPLVRALAWLIGSPGLLAAQPAMAGDVLVSDVWCAEALAESYPLLRALDADPGELEAAVAASKSSRLGRIAECLVGFWIERAERFELLARNLAVRESGRTLGEFDLVFLDRREGVVVHWEMAVKFYLRRRDGSEFLGPEGRDTLSRKADRIFGHQLGLGATPAGQAVLASLCTERVVSRAFVKGWLFHPDDLGSGSNQVNPEHQRGWWRTLDEFRRKDLTDARRYCVMERDSWIVGALAREFDATMDSGAAAAHIGSRLEAGGRALMVAQFDPQWDPMLGRTQACLRESGRGFVVPDKWGASAPP